MPFSMCYDDAKTDTTLRRYWSSSDTPPNPVLVDFIPSSPTEALTGSPRGSFVNASPGAGNKLTASVAPPERRTSKSYAITVTASSGGSAEDFTIELHWDD